MPRKRRSDSKLHGLPAEVQDSIFTALESGDSYKAVRERLALPTEMGGHELEVSESTLCEFWNSRKADQWVSRIRTAADNAAKVAELEVDDAAVTDAIRKGVHEITLDYLMREGSADPKAVKGLVTAVIKLTDQDLKERKLEIESRKLKLLEAKAEQADQAKAAVADNDLTPEQRELRFKEIFGITS